MSRNNVQNQITITELGTAGLYMLWFINETPFNQSASKKNIFKRMSVSYNGENIVNICQIISSSALENNLHYSIKSYIISALLKSCSIDI